jgi:hypothetical protein
MRCLRQAAIASASRSPTTGGRPSSAASQSPKDRKIDAYWRRVLAVAARAAIRSASPNRLRASKLTAGGGISATSSDSSAIAPSTSSRSISGSIEASESCAPLIDPAYS